MHCPVRSTGARIAPEVGFTTNNRMELPAVIAGLRALMRPCLITVLNHSDYVRPGITEFLSRWRLVGWRNSAGQPVLNRDLWEELDVLASEHHVSWVYVREHSGNPEQERCDRLANQSSQKTGTARFTCSPRWASSQELSRSVKPFNQSSPLPVGDI